GSHLLYQADFKDIPEGDRVSALEGVRFVIENRVNSFGVSEPVVQTSGSDKLVVELPGIKDINAAIAQIGQTPILEFKERDENAQANLIPGPDGQVTVDENSFWKSTGLSGKHITSAKADISGGQQGFGGRFVVRLTFNPEGTKLFSDITNRNRGKQVAIFLDGTKISDPVVNEAITTGEAEISGNFTAAQATALATRLSSGALPVPIKLVSQENVGATLGKDSVSKSLVAGLIGVIMIGLFMILYYRFPGLLAVVALCVYALISIAVFKIGISPIALVLVGVFFFLSITSSAWFGFLALVSYIILMLANSLQPVTMTLAGIAGFILSIGMAVDANILIFERLREEIRSGKDVVKAVEDGFARAWSSIRDSNISSLLTCIILYWFGTPSIRGFAVTLGVGILISMFTAISVTRTLIRLFINNKLLSHPWLFGTSKPKPKSEAAAQ
ncbi:MAG TPA: preprotein translocase subunit SecD, partial [Patescibacteria group bacterium]|nr:preprotein translocase subunit SecD [Patescibacteria group bacterium]